MLTFFALQFLLDTFGDYRPFLSPASADARQIAFDK
jgi:hypothetical protein